MIVKLRMSLANRIGLAGFKVYGRTLSYSTDQWQQNDCKAYGVFLPIA